MLQFINRFDGQKGTRLAWMNHGIAHEEYHRGQLALYARLLGRTPALTRRIKGS
ncbi:MAG: DinB family protein [Thermoanaerobaculia bacterium]